MFKPSAYSDVCAGTVFSDAGKVDEAKDLFHCSIGLKQSSAKAFFQPYYTHQYCEHRRNKPYCGRTTVWAQKPVSNMALLLVHLSVAQRQTHLRFSMRIEAIFCKGLLSALLHISFIKSIGTDPIRGVVLCE
jgi:hypothetical protein